MNFKLLFLDNLGGGELLMVVFFVLLFFGSEKIPGLMRGLGRAMREFKTAMDDVKQDIESSVKEPVAQIKDAVEISIKEPTNSISRSINTELNEVDTKNSNENSDAQSK